MSTSESTHEVATRTAAERSGRAGGETAEAGALPPPKPGDAKPAAAPAGAETDGRPKQLNPDGR